MIHRAATDQSLTSGGQTPDLQVSGSLAEQAELILVRAKATAFPPQSPRAEDREPLPEISAEETLGERFLTVAAHFATEPAVLLPTGNYSYADLKRAALAVADRLTGSMSFHAGDRVGLLLPNSFEYVAAFYGVLLAGGVAVPLPANAESSRLHEIAKRCDCRILISSEEVRRRRHDLPIATGELDLLGSKTRQSKLWQDRPRIETNDLATILFTSGSMGTAKGVMLSHHNLLANARSICRYLILSPQERALVILPFCHAFGNSVLQTHILSGASLALAGSLTFPNTILEGILRFAATSFSGVPEVFQILLSRSSLGEEPLPSLRYMAVAGGYLPPDRAAEVARRIAPAKLFVMYGQTEATARLAYLPPELLAERYGSIGRAIPDVELQVVDADAHLVPPGETGEIRARGPNVMQGYWDDPEGTAAVLRDGWLWTGDFATTDEEGFLYPRGQRNALVKIGGFRVHPRELEEFVQQQFDVERAVAVPVEVPEIGARLALFVQSGGDESITAEEITRHCRRGLPPQKVPVYVETVPQLPLNDTLKLDQVALRRRAEEHLRQGAASREPHSHPQP